MLVQKHELFENGSERGATARWFLPLVAATCLIASAAQAQQAGSKWEYTITPYLWMPGLEGVVSPGPNAPPLDVDVSFSDILDEVDIGFVLGGTATRGAFGLFGDIQYFDLNSANATPGPLPGSAVVDTDITVFTFGMEYTVVETPNAELRLAAAARYFDVSIDGSLSIGALPVRQVSGGDDWWDGLVGIRGTSMINQDWYFTGWALVGAGGSDFSSDVFGCVGYQVSDLVDIVGGIDIFQPTEMKGTASSMMSNSMVFCWE